MDPTRDMHSEHASIMFGRTITKDDKKERTLAKNLIYAIRGGGGDMAIQMALAKQDVFIDMDVIARWRSLIFGEYPEMPQWIEQTDLDLAAQIRTGKLRMIRNAFGRPRILLGHGPLKEALATIISGTAADGMSFVLTRLAQYHPEVYRYVALQIHDSFIIHAPTDKFDYVMQTVYNEMTRPWWTWEQELPLRAEPSEANGTWAHMEAWKAA
jgi:DNA polymerase I-like protein with 3'-5' exonuclease and polymerase domains